MSNKLEKLKYKLKDLLVKELSLVDRGANQGAHVLLFKRDDSNNDILSMLNFDQASNGDSLMNFDEIMKKLAGTLDEKLAPVVTKVNELDEAVKASKVPMKEDPVKEKETEKPTKKTEVSVDVDEVTKTLKEQSEAFSKQLEEIRKESEAMKKFAEEQKEARERLELERTIEKDYPYLQGELDQKVNLVKSLQGDEYGLSVLKAMNDSNKSKFGVVGHSVSVSKSNEDKLDELAKSLQAKETNLTYEQAYAKVLSSPEGSKLYMEQG